jgi:hypothetical protein
MGHWAIGAQLSTGHSAPAMLSTERMVKAIAATRQILDLDIIILGSREHPEIFRDLTGASRPQGDLFVWYDLLSDFAGMEDSDLVVNWRGEKSRGWGGWAEAGSEVTESFRFGCPNNPSVRAKTLGRLRQLLEQYRFDGAFLDKMRFPSPANGLEETASCFCDHCRNAATRFDFDLDRVARALENGFVDEVRATSIGSEPWLDAVFEPDGLIGRFLAFRTASISALIGEVAQMLERMGRRLALDLFSPALAPLVGQSYAELTPLSAWIKPMTYRVAKGPAGLRLEVPAIIEGITRMTDLSEAQIDRWAMRNIPHYNADSLSETRRRAIPLPLMEEEIAAAVRMSKGAPVYFGLEMVQQHGVIDITPELVRDMVAAGRNAGASGAIISWDLLHVPAPNLLALAHSLG